LGSIAAGLCAWSTAAVAAPDDPRPTAFHVEAATGPVAITSTRERLDGSRPTVGSFAGQLAGLYLFRLRHGIDMGPRLGATLALGPSNRFIADTGLVVRWRLPYAPYHGAAVELGFGPAWGKEPTPNEGLSIEQDHEGALGPHLYLGLQLWRTAQRRPPAYVQVRLHLFSFAHRVDYTDTQRGDTTTERYDLTAAALTVAFGLASCEQ
jgi:hypothetical protein